MGKRVYSAARTDPLITTGLINKFTNPRPTPVPRPARPVEVEHVHGRGHDYQAGCPQCQTINRAYYHAHKNPGTRSYKPKEL